MNRVPALFGVLLLMSAGVGQSQSFPFPRSGDPLFAYAHGTKPHAVGRGEQPGLTQGDLDAAVVAAYEVWRATFLQRITHAEIPAIPAGEEQAFVNVSVHEEEVKKEARFRSVSEGHGYGMLIAALMAGHPRAAGVPADREHQDFDALYRFFRAHPSVPDAVDEPTVKHAHLMAYQVQGKDLATVVKRPPDSESDSASDGDMDIAYALLLAVRQWGNSGPINYGAEARAVLREIEEYDVNPIAGTVKLGDALTPEYNTPKEKAENKYYAVRTSDFMPQHWTTFARVGNRPLWERVRTQTLAIEKAAFIQFAPQTGLMPDFLQLPPGVGFAPEKYHPPTGFFQEDEENNGDGNWSYNACRTPWRLATDWLLNGATESRDQLRTLNTWVISKAARDGAIRPTRLNAGYTLAGEKLSVKEGKKTHFEEATACFLAPLAVSAMLGGPLLDPLWDRLTTPAPQQDAYFDSTVRLLCLITISGNWWDPRNPKLP